eukprot:c7177_g1_i1 orf=93-284(+)
MSFNLKNSSQISSKWMSLHTQISEISVLFMPMSRLGARPRASKGDNQSKSAPSKTPCHTWAPD